MRLTKVERLMYAIAVAHVEAKYKKHGFRRSGMKRQYRDELARIKARGGKRVGSIGA